MCRLGCHADARDAAPVVDVREDLQSRANWVTIRVACSQFNRLLARGYYEKVPDIVTQWGGNEPQMQTTTVHDHGLLGPVRLVREATGQ